MSDPRCAQRPEFVRDTVDLPHVEELQKPLCLWERVWALPEFRKALLLAVMAGAWEWYGRHLDNSLLFPTFLDTLSALFHGVRSGVLPAYAWASLKLLLVGYGIGMVLAAVMSIAAITTRLGNDLLETLTAMLNPLPAIALLPLALIWIGLGSGSIVFVLVHSVLWTVALNTHSGFKSVSPTLRKVGRNYGLTGMRYVWHILVPASLPSILTGMKIGWAFAWRTLIAAELVFGVAGGTGGLGWYIYENKNELDIPKVFAGLLSVVLIGLLVEYFIFRLIEKHTVRKWGM